MKSFPFRSLGVAILAAIATLATSGVTPRAADAGNLVFSTGSFKYEVSPTGKNLAFTDTTTGREYLRVKGGPCATLRRKDGDHVANRVSIEGSMLRLGFENDAAEVLVRTERKASHLQWTVDSIQGEVPESLVFLDIPLSLVAKPFEPFAACAFSMNLQTHVERLPALQSDLRAVCYKKFGLVGSQVAIIGVPMAEILPTLREVVSLATNMPLCKVAGPWAQDVPFNHGSYLFNFGTLVETNVDDWISMARSLGVTQIDNHGGGSAFFRFGDFELNTKKWPEGWGTYQRMVQRLHDAGIGSIFHTYAFFIDKGSKYVTPIPDKRLDAFRSFTLAEPISETATELKVEETTLAMSTITGFFEHNSVVLHLGDELTVFGGVRKEPPWGFTTVQRGAFGTKAAAHDKGTKARHLKECFGLFVPDVETSLFEEIAANHAEVVNRCGFDGIYLDAIDGSSILRGSDECWYWADKFLFAIQSRLKRPVGMEMSSMWHHFWQYRTRWQAWDYPQRGQKTFIDKHAEGLNDGLLLPLHLGWWNFQTFDPPQVEPSYPDVMEHVGARLVGWNAGISMTGAIDRERLRKVPLVSRAVETLRICEELRHSGLLSADTRARLREPGAEFALVRSEGKPTGFRRTRAIQQIVAASEDWTRRWVLTNEFEAQPVRLRIEALMGVGRYDDATNVVLADAASIQSGFWKTNTASSVSFSMAPADAGGEPGSTVLRGLNTGSQPRNACWGQARRQYAKPIDLRGREALGVWVEGDGQGEVLAFRFESPQHLAFGAIADRYIVVDFTGRRFFPLLETESTRWADYVWNDGKGLYNVHRETVLFESIENVSIWMQNLPKDKEARCVLSPVKAVPMKKTAMTGVEISINGTRWEFTSELVSGGWIEATPGASPVQYGAKGEVTPVKASPDGAWPQLRKGRNEIEVRLTPQAEAAASPRAKVTVFTDGPEV